MHPKPDPVRVTFNDGVAFAVELAVVAILCAWGFIVGSNLVFKLMLGLGAPALAITLWALFAAPKSMVRARPAEIGVKALVLGGGILAAFSILTTVWAVAFTAVVIVNTLLLYVGPFARRGGH